MGGKWDFSLHFRGGIEILNLMNSNVHGRPPAVLRCRVASSARAVRQLAFLPCLSAEPNFLVLSAHSPSLPLPSLLSPSVLPRLNAGERPRPPWSLAELRGHRSSTQP